MSEYRCDIAVIGAGSAGIAAAISAARAGASVALVERDTLIGGNATTARVGTICGLARCGNDAPRVASFDNPGFASEFAQRVATASSTTFEVNDSGLAYLPYRVSAFAEVAEGLLRQNSDISLLRGGTLSAISRLDPRDFRVGFNTTEGEPRSIETRAIIDASGDAIVSQALGLPTEEPVSPQAASLVFELRGLPDLDERALSFSARKILRESSLAGCIPESHTYLSIVPGSLRDRSALFKLGTDHPHQESVTEALRDATAEVLTTIVDCLRRGLPDFSNITHYDTAPRLGVRSGRRGIGEERLTEENVRLSQRHIRGIALGFWPAELWSTPARPTVTFPEVGNAYEIPIGSLCARGAPGVYFAGRVISASDYAIASARVIGTCLSTGYAAGRLAVGELRGESVDAIVSDIRAQQVEPFYAHSSAR